MTSLGMNYAAEQRQLTMNYAHCSPSAAFSPPLFSLYFWVTRRKVHEEGQTEGMHRAPLPRGSAPALQAVLTAPAELAWLSLAGDTMPS